MIPSGQTLLDMMVVVGFVASIMASLMSVRSQQRIQRREVSMATEHASRMDLEALMKRVDKIEVSIEAFKAQMHSETQRILDAGERRSIAIHERINPIEGLKTAIEINNQRLAHLEVNFNNMNMKGGH